MAGDWIKMRGGLFNSPKLIAMSRVLHRDRDFRDWLTPGGGGPMNGQLVSDHALRCVTGALLCVTWSWSREFGKALPTGDCFLPQITIEDLDGIAGAPGVGHAMSEIGWAEEADEPTGVILPNFFGEFNIPLTPAEKQRAYRDRKRLAGSVTEPLPRAGNKTVTREEKRREENRRLRQTSVVDADGDMNVWIRAKDYANRELKPKLGNKSKADQNTALKVAYLHLTGRVPESAVAESLDFGVVAKPWAIFTVRFKERVGGPARFKQLLASVNVPAHIPVAADCGDLDELLESVKGEVA